MDRLKIAKIIEKELQNYIAYNRCLIIADKIIASERECQHKYYPGSLVCEKCGYNGVHTACSPPKNKIEPLNFDELALRVYKLAVNDLKKRFEEISYNKQ